MNEFEIHFINEIKRLHIRKLDVLECLDITLPTLNSKIKEPGGSPLMTSTNSRN